MVRALITGASAGIGKEFAWQLARRGEDLVLVARNPERLTELADEIAAKTRVDVEVLPADLTDLDDCNRVAERLKATEKPVTTLVNNAGFGPGQKFIGGDLQREIAGLHLMVRAVMVLSHAAGETMRARRSGKIINISSMTAFTAQSTYSAHKAWVRTFSEGLAAQLNEDGVTVTAVSPGLTRTEFHERAHVDASTFPALAFLKPEQVVREALEAADKGKVLITPSIRYKIVVGALRLTPRSLVRKFAGPDLSGY